MLLCYFKAAGGDGTVGWCIEINKLKYRIVCTKNLNYPI